MTPDVVLQRYLHLVDAAQIDRSALLELIGADADLLARWLRQFALPVSPEALSEVLRRLDDDSLRSVAEAHALALTPPGGPDRLTMGAWRQVLWSGCLAEQLATVFELADARALRWRILLGVSELSLPTDVLLGELQAFRGTAPELLEDAGLVHRIYAIVDAQGASHETQELMRIADLLLGLSPDRLTGLIEQARERLSSTITALQFDGAPDLDPGRVLWRRQQVLALEPYLAAARRSGELAREQGVAARAVLGAAPQLWLEKSGTLELQGADGHPLQVRNSSSSSRIAQVFRTQSEAVLAAGTDSAVVDRQALALLAAERALVVPVGTPACGVVLFALANRDEAGDADADAGDEDSQAMLAYARSLGRFLTTSDDSEQKLLAFRDQELRRLREIVHEVNNPMSVVANYLHILRLRAQDDERMLEHVDIIASELRRASELLRRVLELPALLEPVVATDSKGEPVRLNELVTRIATLQRGAADETHVVLETRLYAAELEIRSDGDRIMQILTNLTKNAVEAMPDGGRLTLTTNRGVVRAGRRMVEVGVEDTGPGLPDEILERLFEPKETTKGADHAGLGLHLASRLTAELEGELDVRSSENGTQFFLYLPV